MRPLNRPMFKMGGPIKEGIMDGIKEPQATFGVGNNANRDPRTGREKHAVFLAAGIPAALTAARVAIPAALRAFGPAAARGFKAARGFGAVPAELPTQAPSALDKALGTALGVGGLYAKIFAKPQVVIR